MGEMRPFVKGDPRASAGGRATVARRKAEKANPSLKMARKMPELFDELLRAANGEGDWKELPLPQRLTALFKALEYGAGKPIGRDKTLEPAPAGEGDGIEQAGGLSVV